MEYKSYDLTYFSPDYNDIMVKIANRLGWMPERVNDNEYIFTMPAEDVPIFDILTDF